MSDDFFKVGCIFMDLKPDFFRFEPNLDILHHFINNEQLWKLAHESFFKHLSEIRERNRQTFSEDPDSPF